MNILYILATSLCRGSSMNFLEIMSMSKWQVVRDIENIIQCSLGFFRIFPIFGF
jgi:hypothetical protein